MPIRQLQVAHDNVQDRLVLRVGTQANEEIRIFLTRRFVRELWPVLTATLSGHLGTCPRSAPEAGGADAPAATFAEPFREENPTYPLGSTPLLASEATVEPAGDGLCRLILREGRERSFTLTLNTELMQALCSMLRASGDKARWDLTLDYAMPPSSGTPAGNKALLH
jgi:hypothetical protein